MTIFKTKKSLEDLNQRSKNTLNDTLQITFTAITENSLTATMPVTPHCHQVHGILHGGASAALAESVGSVAGTMCLTPTQKAVGLEINANHIRPVKSGLITATATPLHLGQKTQVWDIKITNDQDKLVCIARLTLAVLE